MSPLHGGLLALGVAMPQSLALVGIAYAPLMALGMAPNPLWCLWSAIAGALLMAALTRGGAAIYGVRPSAALLYGSTLAVCATLAPSLKLGAMGVLGLTAATMMLSAAVIWLAVRTGATVFARYLPAPVGRGLGLGIGLTILWLQVRAVNDWFVGPGGRLAISTVVMVVLLALLVRLALVWKRNHPSKPYLLALLPVAAASVWVIEVATGLPFMWVSAPAVASFGDLVPPSLAANFAYELFHADHWAVVRTALTVLSAQALFVAFTFIVDSAGNAVQLEQATGRPYDVNSELRAAALAMAVLPWFGLLPVGSNFAATRPLIDGGMRDEPSLRASNATLAFGLALMLALAFVGLNRVPVLFVTAALIVIGLGMLDPVQLARPAAEPGARQMWWQTWMIGLVFLFTSGVFAMLAGFAVAVAQFVRGAEGAVVRSVYTLRELRSRRWRGNDEETVLRQYAQRVVIVVLQGTASFAVARRIREEISRIAQPGEVDVLLVDAQRVAQWDVTALDSFARMARELRAGGVAMLLSHPSDTARKTLANIAGLFDDTDHALEWAENELLRRKGLEVAQVNRPLASAADLPLCARLSPEARASLPGFGLVTTLRAGEQAFNTGDRDSSLMALLSGSVSIEMPAMGKTLRVATFVPGMVFGEMAFLDGSARSARAVALEPSQVFYLPRERFVAWAQKHPQDGQRLLNALAAQMSQRLRFTTAQLIALNP